MEEGVDITDERIDAIASILGPYPFDYISPMGSWTITSRDDLISMIDELRTRARQS